MATTHPTSPDGSRRDRPSRKRRGKLSRDEEAQQVAALRVSEVVDDDPKHWTDVLDPEARTAILLRISQDSDLDGHGVGRDAFDTLTACRRDGTKVRPDPDTGLPVWVDNNRSASKHGTSKAARASFARVVDMLRDGTLDRIVFTKVDRLVRNLRELEDLCDVADDAKLHKRTVTFSPITASDLDLNSAAMRGVARLLCTIGAMEVDQSRERIMTENAARRRRGRFVGGHAPMGYVLDREAPGGLAIDPVLGPIVVAAVDAVIDGTGFAEIAKQWNEENVARPIGRDGTQRAVLPWNVTDVRQRLNRPAIAGIQTYQAPKDSQGNRPPIVEVGDGAWIPLIGRPRWDELQAVLASNRRTYGGDRPQGPYTSLFVCPCGGTLYRHVRSSGRGHTWSCLRSKLRPGTDPDLDLRGCGHNAYDGPTLEEWVDRNAPARLVARKVGTSTPTVDTEALRAEVVRLDRRLDVIREAKIAGRYDDCPEDYYDERDAVRKLRTKAKLAVDTAELEAIGARRTPDGLLTMDYEDMDDDGRRRVIESAFPYGVLAVKGQTPIALGPNGQPEEEEESAA